MNSMKLKKILAFKFILLVNIDGRTRKNNVQKYLA